MRMGRLFGRKRRNEELEAEIQAHLAMAAGDRMERGEEPAEAARAARREFGNRALIQETTREMWGWRALEVLGQDARYALRGMGRSPGFTAVAVLSLALGIGANTAIFSLVNALLLRMLPVHDPGRLVELLFKAPGQDHFNAFDWKNYEHYRENNHVFAGVIAASDTPFAVRGEGLEPETVRGGYVSDNYFSELGVRAAVGRLTGAEDSAPGSPGDVAVVSWRFWKSRLHGDPAVAGRRILDGAKPLTIIGVAGPGFEGLEPANRQDIWLPLSAEHPRGAATAEYWLKLAARLKPGVTLQQARAEMAVLYRWTVEKEFAAHNDATVLNWRVEVQPAGAGLSRMRDQFGKPALVLMAVVALLLLIACANVASLLMARGAGRQREMAVRVSLGAGRMRLLRQGLTESALLAAAGGAIGVAMAYWGTGALVRVMGSGRARIDLQASPDLTVLLFTAAVALLTGIVFGLAPAWQAMRAAPASFLRDSGRAGETRGRRLLGKGLVAAQVAFSVALLSAAGLFIRHLEQLEHLDLGFQRDHVLLVWLNTAGSGYKGEQISRLNLELLGRLEAIPGVRSATLCLFFPMAGVGGMRPANVEGYQAKPGERRFLSLSHVAPKYFATFGIPLVMGRDFTAEDAGRPRVAIVNQTLARYFFGGGNPIGRHITFDGDKEPFEIVGVARDAKSADMRDPELRFVYMNSFQMGDTASQFALRTAVDPQAVEGDVRRVVRGLVKTASVEFKTLDEQVDGALVPERLTAILSGLFGALGASLAALGLYGLLAYMVARRINEIGIRVALGAGRGDITRMVLRDAAAMSAAGLAVGVPLAYWGKRVVASVLPGLPAESILPVAAGAGVMVVLALAASYVPARRATRVDPMEALRYD
jgi:putative ABC transport system permease protein